MYFERLLLTNKYEIYRFSREIEVITYLVFEDTFSKAGQAFGDAIYDQDFEANNNQIVVRCATLADFTEKDREEILSFCESMLSFKPSIDYCVDFFLIIWAKNSALQCRDESPLYLFFFYKALRYSCLTHGVV
ncbi:hypothetical protein [Enterococcus saccharolyticus]|uniref:Uncharacterized protein n=1 Tax=Enterococcus saccharolyticus subsp. saccharolyticus ATCC 43076 TaxID=1139996 RepID=S0J0Z0_9ENTE|nr:hypothetical protein [Enterococcus saccharolyticus]EOT25877.1 hypothetical protein OMQ_02347 [Enterococcus saccharolyticus subsp. saccharolyticus ATCC 43076]EOT82755.1 hypothetical protein I572_00295 [Enterococcus saccharolyticus subsp. saccharolyticus ATCC 43076]OJG91117.1 hypothetical protein RV16_GL000103 [Enterococcus saccharolyticus]